MLQQSSNRNRGGFGAQDAAAERDYMEISCPRAFNFLVRPAALRTHESSHGLRCDFATEKIERFALALREHHGQSIDIQCCLEPDG